MAIALLPLPGGIVAQLDGEQRRLVLRNAEIERFEAQHNLGIFAVLDALYGAGAAPQVRHIRDLVALGLVGGGLPDRAADDVVASMPPHENHRLRSIAADLVLAAFVSEEPQKKSEGAGSDVGPGETETAGMSPAESAKSPAPVSAPSTSDA